MPKMPEVTSVVETIVVEVAAVPMKAAEAMTTVETVASEYLVTAAMAASIAFVTARHRFCR